MTKLSLLELLRLKKKLRGATVCGVVWYTPEGWARLKATASDPDNFEATFAEWLEMAEAAMVQISRTGLSVRKVLLDPDEFQAWCLRNRERNEASARSKYVNEWLRLHDAERNA
jgi:hypothetical protein